MKIIRPNRRLFIAGGLALAAPAILRAQVPMTGAGLPKPGGGGGGLGLQTSCTGFWEFKTTSWTDSTGNGTSLTGTGAPAVSTGPGTNSAVLFDGSSSLSAASNSFILNGSNSFSVQAWANLPGPTSSEIVFNKDNNSFGQREWGIGNRFTSSNFWDVAFFNTSTTNFAATATTLFATGWHQIVITFNSSSGLMLIYVDGAVAGSGTTISGPMNSTASAPLNVGFFGSAIANTAKIALCGFWQGRVLSAGDITLLYNSGSGLSFAAML
jgi:hypothetical protein